MPTYILVVEALNAAEADMTDAREMRADGQTTRAIALAARAFGRADAIRTICIRNGMDGNNDRTRQAGRIKVAAERLLTDLKWHL